MTSVRLSRRSFLAAGGGAVAVAAAAVGAGMGAAGAWPLGSSDDGGPERAMFAYVGCYTTAKREGHGQGIAVFQVDRSGRWEPVQVLPTTPNPSYLITDRAATTLYSAEGDGNRVTFFRIDSGTGHLTELGTVDTGGTNGVHLSLSPDETRLVVANYATGSIAVFPRAADGTLGPRSQLVQLTGTPGPLPEDQKGPQPHQVLFEPTGRHLIVPDKGTDRLHRLGYDPASGSLSVLGDPVLTPPGTGPRHLAYHPYLPAFYLVDELSSQVTVYHYDQQTAAVTAGASVSTVPAGVEGESTAAAIVISRDGRFVHVSNRGHDSVASFGITPVGSLLPPALTDTAGHQPRFMTLDPPGGTLYVANQKGDSIVAFALDPVTGRLDRRGEPIATGTPSCITFVDAL
ncbi:lactonase family protein [Rhodococcus sp. T2V]|uniref:lactonase family protein n=1 Tax=Rhodococcus sp. T2V TaxID=3034164 RepID=UPI0023E299A0|nr:lactonase family protein [Rhodococcus sp. T2V]MDF3312034.1 lactonase family protein [Rhodococcus sp. T2V]